MDDIYAGDGADRYSGGEDNDTFYSLDDGDRDFVYCGPGYDIITFRDAIDRTFNCEASGIVR
jgi:hypothetical protein